MRASVRTRSTAKQEKKIDQLFDKKQNFLWFQVLGVSFTKHPNFFFTTTEPKKLSFLSFFLLRCEQNASTGSNASDLKDHPCSTRQIWQNPVWNGGSTKLLIGTLFCVCRAHAKARSLCASMSLSVFELWCAQLWTTHTKNNWLEFRDNLTYPLWYPKLQVSR